MTIPDSFELLAGVPLVAIIPALVEIAKAQGLPVRYAGLAAIVAGMLLLAIAGTALDPTIDGADIAHWVVGGIVYGLAAAGLYSQREVILPQRSTTDGA